MAGGMPDQVPPSPGASRGGLGGPWGPPGQGAPQGPKMGPRGPPGGPWFLVNASQLRGRGLQEISPERPLEVGVFRGLFSRGIIRGPKKGRKLDPENGPRTDEIPAAPELGA